ncbi:MAG: HNH endonuclease signature motif containing protein, partial [Ktedonobacterales bacterium]
AEYGISSHYAGQYEVDHLVSLELGGSNDIANLWPELASPTPGFHQKDKVENYMHDQVCSGAVPLATAQQEIATNWLALYQQMGG